MKMTEEDKTRLFREAAESLAEQKSIDVSADAVRFFFESTEPETDAGFYTLLMSYHDAKEHPYFYEISEAQESVQDYPGIVFSFTDETLYLDCGSEEGANATDVWDWFIHVSTDIEFALQKKGQVWLNLPSKWTDILGGAERSIKEAMNFLYQHQVLHDAFPPHRFTQHHGDTFIRSGYQKFNWVSGLALYYVPEIQKIDSTLKLKRELDDDKTTITRRKI